MASARRCTRLRSRGYRVGSAQASARRQRSRAPIAPARKWPTGGGARCSDAGPLSFPALHGRAGAARSPRRKARAQPPGSRRSCAFPTPRRRFSHGAARHSTNSSLDSWMPLPNSRAPPPQPPRPASRTAAAVGAYASCDLSPVLPRRRRRRATLARLPSQELLLLDMGHLRTGENSHVFVPVWPEVVTADLSQNQIAGVDESIVSFRCSIGARLEMRVANAAPTGC